MFILGLLNLTWLLEVAAERCLEGRNPAAGPRAKSSDARLLDGLALLFSPCSSCSRKVLRPSLAHTSHANAHTMRICIEGNLVQS